MLQLHRRALLAGAAAAALAGRFLAMAAEAVGTIVGAINSASSTPPGGQAEPVQQDKPVEAGEEVATGPQSAVQVALYEGSVVTVGADSKATFGAGDSAVLLGGGHMRFRTGAGAPKDPQIETAALRVQLIKAEMIVSAAPGKTSCGVISGRIVCSSIKSGKAVEVKAGESVVWADGSFGGGVTATAYLSGDPAVDEGMEAARAAYE